VVGVGVMPNCNNEWTTYSFLDFENMALTKVVHIYVIKGMSA
jgi:hypothetical protein